MSTSLHSVQTILDRMSGRDIAEMSSALILPQLEESLDAGGTPPTDDDEGAVNDDGFTRTGSVLFRGAMPGIRFTGYFTAVAAPFLVKSLSAKEEVEALFSFFYEQILRITKEKQLEPRLVCDGASYYLVTNLSEASLRPSTHPQHLETQLSVLTERLGKNPTFPQFENGQVGIFTADHIAQAASEYPAFEARLNALAKEYGRLLFEIDDRGRVHIETAFLNGCKCISIGTVPTLSTVSTSMRVADDIIGELEALVNSSCSHETDLQRFFERHPELLSMGDFISVFPQISLVRQDGSFLRPDFMLEPTEGPICAILDIKRPSERLVIPKRNRPRFTAKIFEYIGQLREYGRYFDSYSNRRWFRQTYGLTAFQPRLILVVGRDYTVADYSMLERLRRDLHDVEVLTYDDLINTYRRKATSEAIVI